MIGLNLPAGKGQCDIRLLVDGDADVSVRGDRVSIRTIAGRDAQDDGSECNQPLPAGPVRDLRFEVKKRRNEIRMVEGPDARNGFAALVRIRDTEDGEGRYQFRLTWNAASSERPAARYDNPDQPAAGAGFSWNNTTSMKGNGRGRSLVNGANEILLRQVSVEIDRTGKVAIWFRAEGRKLPVTFSGQLLANESGRLKVDAMTEDRRLRGSMWITVDARQQVESVAMQATDGRDQMTLAWERR
ncbi:MAG: hypothetical protein ABI759_20845 [Candidatus Solibacter sp.]